MLIEALLISSVRAEEERCTDLGASCICSEPLNTGTYTNNGASYRNPSDSVTKECSHAGDGSGGWAVESFNPAEDFPTNDSSDPAAFAALPTGHRVQWFYRDADSSPHIWHVGGYLPVESKKRVAARWYSYHAPNLEFRDPNTGIGCSNYLALLPGIFFAIPDGVIAASNFLDWTPSIDCCNAGPGPGDNTQRSDWLGRWWRIELVETNLDAYVTGQSFRAQLFIKDLASAAPERLIIDSDNLPIGFPHDPNKLMDSVFFEGYRGVQAPGTCQGWQGVSHFMVASWPTDQGQRIGPAFEIEGRTSADVYGGSGDGGSGMGNGTSINSDGAGICRLDADCLPGQYCVSNRCIRVGSSPSASSCRGNTGGTDGLGLLAALLALRKANGGRRRRLPKP